jgi:uncharacterized protein (DUF1810 family)
MQDDPYDLRRFVEAQREVYAQVCSELRAGRKTSHWIWFIFPQIHGLGRSAMAQRFAISSLDEARAYLAHPTLGPRLIECTELVLGVQGRSIEQILGDVDAMKFRSSMTLFARAATEPSAFTEALNRLFGGEPDALTLSRL